MRAKTLLKSGAKVVEPLQFHRARPKVSGYMWSGTLVLEKNGIKYHFEMWYHGGDTMNECEALDHVSLKGITYHGKYYDVYWYTVMTEDEIYLHPAGWFEDKILEKEVEAIRKVNYNFARDQLSDSQKEELLILGFIKIAEYKETIGRAGIWEFRDHYPEEYEAMRPERSGVIVTVSDRGDTDWEVGDSIAAEEFDIENGKMRSLGKRPALGEYHY